MSDGVKATFVVCGLVGFFLIAVVGPLLGDAGSTAVELVLGHDDEKRVENRKIRKDPRYGASGELKRARDCCTSCKADWNHHDDRCELQTQALRECYTKACSD